MKHERPSCAKAFFVLCVLAASLLTSCFEPPAEVAGTYEFSYPFGVVEVLTLEAGGRLQQRFYQNWYKRQEKIPYLVHRGSWAISGSALDFDHVYKVSDLDYRVPRKVPELISGIRGLYLDEVDGKPVIRFFDEGDCFYTRIEPF
ncbi:MAG: hypothetical protein V4599_04370 [Verrucomicrobiota bacterium]